MWTLLLALAVAAPLQFKTAGNAAFLALRDYQFLVLAHELRRDAWPPLAQQAEIDAKLAIGYDSVIDSLKLGVEIDPVNGVMAPVLSLLRSERQAVGALGALTVGAPADVQAAWKKVEAAFTALFNLFPDAAGESYEHPPKKP